MQRRVWMYLGVGLVLGLGLGVAWGIFRPQATVAPTVNKTESNTNADNTNQAVDSALQQTFSTADLPDRDPAFNFSVGLPKGWVAEYVTESQAINFYDPASAGTTTLEQSQIFVRYFEANEFQTLTTVTVKSRTPSTLNGRPTVTYVIEKKPGQAVFLAQPSWRNQTHTVTDIRTTDATPAIFYVWAQAPALDPAVFAAVLASLRFSASSASSATAAT